MASGPIIS
jgi:hypothetical protein